MRFNFRSYVPVALAILLATASAHPLGEDTEKHAAREVDTPTVTELAGSAQANVVDNAAAFQTPFPVHKCLIKTKCPESGACSGGSPVNLLSNNTVALSKRAFKPITDPAFKNFPKVSKYNKDATLFENRNTGFMDFSHERFQSVRIEGLVGCAVVAAYSHEGMIVSHIFEDGRLNADTADGEVKHSLHPNAAKDTIKDVAALFKAEKDKLHDGQLVVLLPVNKGTTDYRYEKETWEAISPDGKKFVDGKTVGGKGTVKDIVDSVKEATGLDPHVVTYGVSTGDESEDPPVGSILGTFAIEFDPDNEKDEPKKAVQVYNEGKPIGEPFRF